MPSFLLSETNDRFEIRVLDGTSVDDGIFDELSPAVESGTGTVVMDFEGVQYAGETTESTRTERSQGRAEELVCGDE